MHQNVHETTINRLWLYGIAILNIFTEIENNKFVCRILGDNGFSPRSFIFSKYSNG